MRFCISLTTAAAFWLHLLLGCCAHHAHATKSSSCAQGDHSHSVAGCGVANDVGHVHGEENTCGQNSHTELGEHAHHDGDDRSHAGDSDPGQIVSNASDDYGSPCHHQHNDCHESHCSAIVKVQSSAIAQAMIAELAGQLSVISVVAAPTAFDRYPADTSDGRTPPIALYLAQQTLLI